MTDLIDPNLLDQPDVRAAIPTTARKGILRPLIAYINMLYKDAMTRTAADKVEKRTLTKKIAALQASHDALAQRLSALESTPKQDTFPLSPSRMD